MGEVLVDAEGALLLTNDGDLAALDVAEVGDRLGDGHAGLVRGDEDVELPLRMSTCVEAM